MPRDVRATAAFPPPLKRFPIRGTHLINKKSLRFKELEPVLIEKVAQLFRNML